MPNPLSVLRHLVPRRITPDMLAMDADGITGQRLQDQPQPLPDDPGGPSVQPPPESSLPPRPQLPQDPQSRQALPNSAFAGAGVPQGGVQDPTINRIAQEGLNAPQLPPRPSGWRQALGVTASMLGGAAFDPLIEYGAKGARQMADYNRWKSELPERVAVGKMYTDQQHAENSSRQADETRQLREFQQNEAQATRQQQEQDAFMKGGGRYLPAGAMGGTMNVPSQTMTSTPPPPSALPSRPSVPASAMRRPGFQGPEQPQAQSQPLIPPAPPINQPQNLTVPAGQITAEPGRIATPAGYFDPTTPANESAQGKRRIQPTEATRAGEVAAAKKLEQEANWQVLPIEIAKHFGIPPTMKVEPEKALPAYLNAYTASQKESDKSLPEQVAERTKIANSLKLDPRDREVYIATGKIERPAVTNNHFDLKQEQELKTASLKSYTPALDSAERFNVMAKNFEDAMKTNDQQAMLSLLANHLGMTMGLQKGARLNQAIILEAQKSRPWLQGMLSKFDKDGYLTGLTLTPQQMRQMVDMGRERYTQDVIKARSEAKYLGVKDDGPERIPSQSVVNHYLGLAHGDPNGAKQLMAQDGWTVN